MNDSGDTLCAELSAELRRALGGFAAALSFRPATDNPVKIFHLAALAVPGSHSSARMINSFLVSDSGIIFTNRRSGSRPFAFEKNARGKEREGEGMRRRGRGGEGTARREDEFS